MSDAAARFDKDYLEAKRRRLKELRDQLTANEAAERNEQVEVSNASGVEPRDDGDDAQKLMSLELSGNLQARDAGRLALVQRALRKLEEGSYGFSDESGDPIPTERLDAMPEAVLTLEEQADLDRRTQRPA